MLIVFENHASIKSFKFYKSYDKLFSQRTLMETVHVVIAFGKTHFSQCTFR